MLLYSYYVPGPGPSVFSLFGKRSDLPKLNVFSVSNSFFPLYVIVGQSTSTHLYISEAHVIPTSSSAFSHPTVLSRDTCTSSDWKGSYFRSVYPILCCSSLDLDISVFLKFAPLFFSSLSTYSLPQRTQGSSMFPDPDFYCFVARKSTSHSLHCSISAPDP